MDTPFDETWLHVSTTEQVLDPQLFTGTVPGMQAYTPGYCSWWPTPDIVGQFQMQELRAHKSYLVNLARVEQLSGNVLLVGACELPVGTHTARRYCGNYV